MNLKLLKILILSFIASLVIPISAQQTNIKMNPDSAKALKKIAVEFAMYFVGLQGTQGGSAFPYPKDKKKALEDLPPSIKLENYIFMVHDKHLWSGSSTIPIYMEKPGHSPSDLIHIVFEDGHVEVYKAKSKAEITRKLLAKPATAEVRERLKKALSQ